MQKKQWGLAHILAEYRWRVKKTQQLKHDKTIEREPVELWEEEPKSKNQNTQKLLRAPPKKILTKWNGQYGLV